MNKNNVNHLLRVPNHKTLNTKKLQFITRQGTKIGEDQKKSINAISQNNDYPIQQRKKKFSKMHLNFFRS